MVLQRPEDMKYCQESVEHRNIEKAAHNQVLVGFVRGLSFLFPGAHESPPWSNTGFDLRKMHLYHHAFFASISVPHLGDAISRSTNFQENFSLHVTGCRCDHKLCFLEVASGTSGKVCLMLLALGVSEV